MGKKLVVGITQGDGNGIGYEVIIKSFADERMLDMCTPVVYGSSKIFGFYRKQIHNLEQINTNVITSAKDVHQKRVNIVNCLPDSVFVEPGQATPESAKSAMASLTNEMLMALLRESERRSVSATILRAYAKDLSILFNIYDITSGLTFICRSINSLIKRLDNSSSSGAFISTDGMIFNLDCKSFKLNFIRAGASWDVNKILPPSFRYKLYK